MDFDLNNYRIGVIIPYYNAKDFIADVIKNLPEYIDTIYLVNDASLEEIPSQVNTFLKVKIIDCEVNLGVGGAVKKGFIAGITDNMDYLIKVDADGQMESKYIPDLLKPLIQSTADYAKGNRFHDFAKLRKMPFIRKIGNLILSFLTKSATGYWHVFDPTNGFFAIKTASLTKMNFQKLSNRYFFETSILSELYFQKARIVDVPMSAVYGDETSNMKVWKMPFVFLPKLIRLFISRIVKRYFIYDFNISSVYLIFGLPLFLFGIIYGVYNWIYYSSRDIFTPTGTIMIITLCIILGFQLLLQVINNDIENSPRPSK